MTYSWSEILSIHEYFYLSKISYEHVYRVWKIEDSNSFDPEKVYLPADCVGVVNELTGGRIKEIIKNRITNSKLNFLFLRNLELDSIFPLSEVIGVQIIDCVNNEIDSLVPLKLFKDLKEVHFAGNRINNINPILKLNIEILDLSGNKIDQISNISELKYLKKLNLCYNNIRDILGITYCNNLTHLNLACNDISEIGDIKHLYNLEELNLGSNVQIKIEDVVKLAKDLPKCRIDIDYITEDLTNPDSGFLKIYNGLVYFISDRNNTIDHAFYIYVYLVQATNNIPNVNLSEDFYKISKELASSKELFNYTYKNDIELVKEDFNRCLILKYNT